MHTMTLVTEHEGTEEWYCDECGRHLLIEWYPWRHVVIEPGDDVDHRSWREYEEEV